MSFQIDNNVSFYIHVPNIQYCRISGIHRYNIVISTKATFNTEWALPDMAIYKPIDILSVPVIYNHCCQCKKGYINMGKPKLVKHVINRDWCKGCGICVEFCPQNVLELDEQDKVGAARPEACIGCKLCELRCPDLAIEIHIEE